MPGVNAVLHLSLESVVGLMTKHDIYIVAPYLAAMELPCKRLAAQLKKIGCRSCRAKRVKSETRLAFQKVTDALYDLLTRAQKAGKDLKPLAHMLSAASKNTAVGIELETSTGKVRFLFTE